MRISGAHDVGFLDVYDAFYRIHSRQMTHPEQARLGEHRLELLDAIDGWLRRTSRPSSVAEHAPGHTFGHRSTHCGGESGTACGGPSPQAFRDHPAVVLDPKMALMGIRALRRLRARDRRLWMQLATESGH